MVSPGEFFHHQRACERRSPEECIMLVRWDPFEEMNRLHDHFFSGKGLSKQAFRVAVDIREEDDAFYVDAEVPGMSAEDIKVDVEKNVLTLSGERKVEKEETEGTFRRVERQYGSFSRSFSLPETVDTDGISADLKDGVLELKLPKKEAPTPKQISVSVGKK
jgi:HSP20 family protein